MHQRCGPALAAELREKLAGKAPLLLPPRDYDTMNRARGNIMVSSDNRKSLGGNIVGSIGVLREGGGESSGNSSGIGSEEDQSPSPEYLAASHDIDNSSGEVHLIVMHQQNICKEQTITRVHKSSLEILV